MSIQQYTDSGPPGVRAYGIGMGTPTAADPHKYDEDCLGLNIWTKPQIGEKSKAVLLWIHGGGKLIPVEDVFILLRMLNLCITGFTAGTAHAPYMNGGRIATEEDVVVVSFK
jgi:cholinesterase